MSQNLQNVVKFQKFQLENLVDFEKCCKTHIYLQNFVLIQPRTSPPKICKIFEKCIFRKCIFEKCRKKRKRPLSRLENPPPRQRRGRQPRVVAVELQAEEVSLGCLVENLRLEGRVIMRDHLPTHSLFLPSLSFL